MKTTITPIACALLLACTGCEGTISQLSDDAAEDTAMDAIPEPVADTSGDATVEPAADTIPEPTTDPAVDTAPEPAADTIPEPTTDPVVDTTTDTITDVVTDGAVGAPCSTEADCGAVPGPGVQCMHDLYGMLTFPGGYCTASCSDDAPCGAAGRCVGMMGWGQCLDPCTSPGECREAEGYTCAEIPYVTSDTYCVPYM
jgi:hypothetical protein